MVPGIPENLSGGDRHDLARSRISKSTGRKHCRDRTFEAHPLSRQLGQLRRTESRTRGATARRLQEPAERNRIASALCRPLPGQGKQSVASPKQAETDRSHGKNHGTNCARENNKVPFPAASAKRSARRQIDECRSCLCRHCRLSRPELSRRARTANGPGWAERRRKIHATEIACRRGACSAGSARARTQCPCRLFLPEPDRRS